MAKPLTGPTIIPPIIPKRLRDKIPPKTLETAASRISKSKTVGQSQEGACFIPSTGRRRKSGKKKRTSLIRPLMSSPVRRKKDLGSCGGVSMFLILRVEDRILQEKCNDPRRPRGLFLVLSAKVLLPPPADDRREIPQRPL